MQTLYIGEGNQSLATVSTGQTLGVKVRFNKPVTVSRLYTKLNGNMIVEPRIWNGKGELIGMGPANTAIGGNAGIHTNIYLPLSSPVTLLPGLEYTIGFKIITYSLGQINVSNNLSAITLPNTVDQGARITFVSESLYNSSNNMPSAVFIAKNTLHIGVDVTSGNVNGKVADQLAGTVIKFAGEDWIILEPSQGYLLRKELDATTTRFKSLAKVGYDPTDAGSIAYQLNNVYYNNMSNNDKSAILEKDWVSYLTPVKAKIGLLSSADWSKYKGANGVLPNPPANFWLVNTSPPDAALLVTISGNVDSLLMTAANLARVRPAIYIKPDLTLLDGTVSYNALPVVTVSSPANNHTLYENDTISINGQVNETDIGNSVTVRYQINAITTRAISAFIADGNIKDFSKQLTFKGGNIYDGETIIASGLTDGVAHTLKVWATDDHGGTSSIIERTFYVVPNRVPLLTINTPVIEGNIDADLINVNGTFSDPDANNAIVSYRINGGSSIQIAEGTNGVFDFTVSFGQLKVGDNTITIEVVDSYGAKKTKTIKLNKKAIETPLLKSTQRYQLLPPSGSAVGVLFYIQRDAALDLDVSISMTQTVEAEQYVQLEPMTTAPISQGSNIVEDEYYYAASDPAEKILLQIDFTRTSLIADEKIYVVMGAFE